MSSAKTELFFSRFLELPRRSATRAARAIVAGIVGAALLAACGGHPEPESAPETVSPPLEEAAQARPEAPAPEGEAPLEEVAPPTADAWAARPVEPAKEAPGAGEPVPTKEPARTEDAPAAARESARPVEPAEAAEAAAASREAAPSETAGSAVEYVVPPGAEEAVKVFPMLKDQWRMWGGNPSRNMVNPFARNIPHEWDITTGKNIRWKADLGSQSYGNPIIADGKILVGTNNDRGRNPNIKGDKGVVMCFAQEDGRFLWQAVHDKLSSGRVNDWPEQGICSSPAVDDGRLYYVSNRCEVVCADLDGFEDGNDGPLTNEKYKDPIDGDFIWIYNMMEELGVFPHNLATSSPVIVDDLVFVLTSNGVEREHLVIPSPRSPSFIALHKTTGELAWESAAPGERILHGQWSCPAYGAAGGRPQVVFPGGDGWLYSFDPKKGNLIWKFDCNPKDSVWELGGLGTRNNIIATPVFYGDTVYIAVGQDPEHGEGIGHLYSIQADGQGDVTEEKKLWHYGGEDFRRTLSTVAVHEGLLYAADLSGFLHCLDAATGKPYWVHDLLAGVWGSPTVIDGKVFLGDEDGDLLVCKTGKTFVKLAEQNMDYSVYTTPVAVGDVLYISNRTTLYAIQEGAMLKAEESE